MPQRPRIPVFIVSALCSVLLAGDAFSAPVTLQGFGTATVDGVVSPGEWASAAELAFVANTPFGGSAPATFLVMNDLDNLYVGLILNEPTFYANSFAVEFDNDDDSESEDGDDVLQLNGEQIGPSSFFDEFRSTAPPCPVGGNCGFFDAARGGRIDGAGAFGFSGGRYVWEMVHPLRSGDLGYDFQLQPGDRIGFFLSLRLIGGAFPDGFGDTDYPSPDFFGDTHIAVQGVPEPSSASLVIIGFSVACIRSSIRRRRRPAGRRVSEPDRSPEIDGILKEVW